MVEIRFCGLSKKKGISCTGCGKVVESLQPYHKLVTTLSQPCNNLITAEFAKTLCILLEQ